MQVLYEYRFLDHCVLSLVLLLVIKFVGLTSCFPCPPVEIGQYFQLACPCGSDRSKVVWETTSHVGEHEAMNACDKPPELTSHSWPRLQVTSNQSHSSLRLTHVVIDDMDRKIQCTDMTETPNPNTKCQMEIFYKPETPFCSAEITGQKSARFTCTTPKVFPGLECHLAYKSRHKRLAEVKVKTEIIQYNVTAVNSKQQPAYLQGSCFVEIADLGPGEYQLFGVLRPNTTFVYNSSVPARATPFVISNTSLPSTVTATTTPTHSLGYMTLLMDSSGPSSLCDYSTHNFTVLCDAHEFTSVPLLTISFNYYYDGQHLHEEVKGDENASTVSASFTAHTQQQNASITCSAQTPFGTRSNQRDISVKWLSQIFLEPRLVSNDERIVEPIKTSGHATVVFTCRVNKEAEVNDISRFLVKCVTEVDQRIVLEKEFVERNFRVILNLTNVDGLVRCICSGVHGHGCLVHASHFEVEIYKPASILGQSVFNYQPLAVMVIIVILVATILSLTLYKLRHRLRKSCVTNPSSRESHIYEDIDNNACSSGCIKYCTKRWSAHKHWSNPKVRCPTSGVQSSRTVTPLIHVNGPGDPTQAGVGQTVIKTNNSKNVSTYSNVINV